MSVFKELLNPLTFKEFSEQYRYKKAVHIKGRKEKFNELINWNIINDILLTSIFKKDYVTIINKGNKIRLNNSDVIPEKILDACSRGATLNIMHIDLFEERCQSYLNKLSKELKAGVFGNLYISQPGYQGLDKHFDDHDVFILQIEGRKKWQVFYPTQKYDREHPANKVPPEDPYLECILEPGDFLYVPFGHWHNVNPLDEPTIHLTAGVIWNTGINFFKSSVKEFARTNKHRILINQKFENDNYLNFLIKNQLEIKSKLSSILSENSILENLYQEFMISRENVALFNFPDTYINNTVDFEQKIFVRNNLSEKKVEALKKNTDFAVSILPIVNFIMVNSKFTGKEILDIFNFILPEKILETVNAFVKKGILKAN